MTKTVKHLLLALVLALTTNLASAADAAKPWTNEAEFSFVSSNGNTKSETLAGKDTFGYKWSKTTLELTAGALASKDKGTSTAEKYNAGEKMTYKLSDRNYAYEKVAWDKDRFSGVKNRWDSGLGLGRELLKNANSLWTVELGGGYLSEERYVGKVNEFSTGRGYTKYVYTISPTANFSQDAEYLQNFKNPDDFRSKTETSLTAALSAHFSMKAYYIWKHVGVPAVGFTRNDTTTGVALVAKY